MQIRKSVIKEEIQFMSYWVYFKLEISGNKGDLKTLKDRIVDNNIIDSLYPIPQELLEIASPEQAHVNEEKEELNIERFGFSNRLDWCLENWGSVFGDYQTKIVSDSINKIIYQMMVKDIFPEDAIIKISIDYPDLAFRIFGYCDDSMEIYWGEAIFKNGESIGNITTEHEIYNE